MKNSRLHRRWSLFKRLQHRQAMKLSPAVRGMLWAAIAGVLFSLLNTVVRSITLNLDVYESLFLRYAFGMLVMLPWVLRDPTSYVPKDIKGQFWRGAVHTLGLMFWFTALPHTSLADMTALGFTGPIFIMLGAAWFLGEKIAGRPLDCRADWFCGCAGGGGATVERHGGLLHPGHAGVLTHVCRLVPDHQGLDPPRVSLGHCVLAITHGVLAGLAEWRSTGGNIPRCGNGWDF